jgi:hypothetical protein
MWWDSFSLFKCFIYRDMCRKRYGLVGSTNGVIDMMKESNLMSKDYYVCAASDTVPVLAGSTRYTVRQQILWDTYTGLQTHVKELCKGRLKVLLA